MFQFTDYLYNIKYVGLPFSDTQKSIKKINVNTHFEFRKKRPKRINA